ncbi:MAG: hypothetical protein PVSMB8_16490 [Vulcanimicrobiaceae bacterium]
MGERESGRFAHESSDGRGAVRVQREAAQACVGVAFAAFERGTFAHHCIVPAQLGRDTLRCSVFVCNALF